MPLDVVVRQPPLGESTARRQAGRAGTDDQGAGARSRCRTSLVRTWAPPRIQCIRSVVAGGVGVDRVVDVLRQAGLDVLVGLGEPRVGDIHVGQLAMEVV